MKRLFVSGVVALAVMSAAVWATYQKCPGCIDRARANSNCEWTGDTAFALDPLNVAHRRHLVADAHLAEELAVRHADWEFGRRLAAGRIAHEPNWRLALSYYRVAFVVRSDESPRAQSSLLH